MDKRNPAASNIAVKLRSFRFLEADNIRLAASRVSFDFRINFDIPPRASTT